MTGLLVRREVNLQVGGVPKQVHFANLQVNDRDAGALLKVGDELVTTSFVQQVDAVVNQLENLKETISELEVKDDPLEDDYRSKDKF